VTRTPSKPGDPPPSLEEQYSVACVTSNLGLPHGPGAGAQGILAAAAWSEVHLGSALRRLRTQWENGKPRKKIPRAYEALKASGMTKVQAKRQHNRERVTFALTYHREKLALKARIPEYAHVLDALMSEAVRLGIEEPDTKALAVLDRWLEQPDRAPRDEAEGQLLAYLRNCLSRAKAALQAGMRGHTKNEKVEE
jgi:hypothetical protein